MNTFYYEFEIGRNGKKPVRFVAAFSAPDGTDHADDKAFDLRCGLERMSQRGVRFRRIDGPVPPSPAGDWRLR